MKQELHKNQIDNCIKLQIDRWSYLRDFLQNKSSGRRTFSIIPQIGCISIKGSRLIIDKTKCIKCLFCVTGCPNIIIDENFSFLPVENKESPPKNKFITDYAYRIFRGSLVAIPTIGSFNIEKKFNSLREFTEIDETQHISIWAARLLHYLSDDKTARLGLEVGMLIQEKDRGGRMDICMLSNDENLFIVEAKVSFEKMMQEGRYVDQILSYRKETNKTLSNLNLSDYNQYIFLLIDGKESDLLYPSHQDCTSNIGNQSEHFYEILNRYKIFFLSSQALWSLALKKMFIDGEVYSLEKVFNRIYREENHGLLSAGIVSSAGGAYKIEYL